MQDEGTAVAESGTETELSAEADQRPSLKLVGALLVAGVEEIIAAGQPNGFWAFGYRGKQTGATRVKVGCRDRSMAEAREYWSPSHPDWSKRQEIPAALDLIEAIARLRGWELPK